MGLDIAVYAQKQEPISPEDILAAMQARGVPVEWKPRSPQNPSRLSGFFLLPGQQGSQSLLSISTEELDDAARAGLLEAYRRKLTEDDRNLLASSQIEYIFSTGFSPSTQWRRALNNLVDVLAQLSDGLILDMSTNQFYDRARFRQTHPGVEG